MSKELILFVFQICADYAAKYYYPDDGGFYDDSDFETAPKSLKKNWVRLPDDEWDKAANEFIELYMKKKDRERFKEHFDISKSDAGFFWIEMEKLDLLYEWRSYFTDFLYKKAEKWCLDNNIPYVETVPRAEDIFCD